ncbi:sulfotransferase domain-containing protein [Prosthecomicrobium pneumaticum]|uniref:Sulfotransferase domain-containing protein n=1 Tax=Prosthecomicrobium pneumaticum TaxID=81895 RepID=A0A7W9L3N2_9HYPH|nr:sulfotransferase domain-containing protein [Prosthecomicrobium pneumaticum]MBB5754731.1 hypothetical protein [Prosthecomicrobium pneumaticum]
MIELGPTRKIVWLASYPRSGNTWVRIFLHNLLDLMRGEDKGGADINDLRRYSAWEASQTFFGGFLPDGVNDWVAVTRARPRVHADVSRRSPRPVILKTHLAVMTLQGHSTINLAATAGAIYIVRNPLDVAVSLAAHIGRPIDATIDFMNDPKAVLGAHPREEHRVFEPMGTWSDNVASWTEGEAPIRLTLRYEDLLDDPIAGFGAIVRHMKIGASAAQIERAVGYSALPGLQAQERAKGFVHGSPAASSAFFRSGRKEAWREALDARTVDRIVGAHERTMRRFGYLPG